MNQFWAMYNVFGKVKVVGAIISGISIFLMMLFITVDVVSRNFLGGSIVGSFEITENYFMPLSVFPALGFVYASGILPKMDLLFIKFKESTRKIVVYAILILEIIIFALAIYYTLIYAMDGLARGSSFPAGGNLMPLYPFMFLVPIGFTLVLVENLFIVFKNIKDDGEVTLLVKEN